MESLPLSRIRIAAPCKSEWKWMYGNDRVRFCSQCNLNVYNLSKMTREEAELLILRTEGRLCVRFYRRRDGTVLTRNCPSGLQAIKDKLTSTSATLLAALLSLLGYIGAMTAWYSSRNSLGMFEVIAQRLGRPDPVIMGALMPSSLEATSPVHRSERFMRDRAILNLIPLLHQRRTFAIRGPVVVRITVSSEGTVEEATLVSGPESLRELAEQAANGWTFRPVVVNGEPTRVETSLTFNLK